MRRTANEVIRNLESRIARLERIKIQKCASGCECSHCTCKRLASLEKSSSDDEYLVNELELFIVNDSGLYRMAQAIVKNQAKHYLKGRWNMNGAIKGFVNLVEAGIKAYRRQGLDLPSRISRQVKEEVAKNLFEYYEDEINELVGGNIRMASVRNAGRRYQDDEWVFFIHENTGLEDDRKGYREAQSLKDQFEECVDTLCDKHNLSICYDDGLSSVSFKAYASLTGMGTGLWDHNHPEASTLEKIVKSDRKCGDLAQKIDNLPYDLGLA